MNGMNKQNFLAMLSQQLHGLPEEDIHKSLEYYTEILEDRMEEGMSEEEAVAALGSMEEITDQIFAETSIPKLVKAKVQTNRKLKAWEIVLLILGSPVWLPLLIAVAAVLFSLYATAWAVVASLYAAVLSFAASALAGIFATFLFMFGGYFPQAALCFGAGLFCAGVTILSFFAVNQIAKAMIILTQNILTAIKNRLIGKGRA